jgi:uncharacterized protein YegJ (DUF2314 family)
MKRHLSSIAILLCTLNAYAGGNKIGDQVRNVSGEDKVMNAAIAQARATFDSFLKVARNPPPGTSAFRIKARVSDEHGNEYLWFMPFREIDGGFAGVLANDPQLITSLKPGSTYGIRREQITDWGYVQDGKQKGSFTVCALFHTMERKQVERYKRDHGFECK